MSDSSGPKASPSTRNAGIDALRGASIILVILNHIGIRIPLAKTALADYLPMWLLRGLNWNGYEAVFIFFVISGFLITRRSLERWGTLAQISIRDFYSLRATRIVPCLLLTIACYSLFHLLAVPNFVIDKPGQSLGGAIAAALGLYLNVYEAKFGYLAGGWDVLWSLSIEEVFYLAFPIICLTLSRTRWLVPLLIVFVLSLPIEHYLLRMEVAQQKNELSEIWLEKAYLPGMAAIAIGVLTALLAQRVAVPRRALALAFCLFGIASLTAIFFAGRFVFHWLGDGYMLLLTGAAAAIVLGAHWLDAMNANPKIRGLAWLRSCGKLSYEIYLFHMFVVFAVVALAKQSGLDPRWGFVWYLPALAFSWLFGLAIARGFSQPVERRLRQRFAHRENEAALAETAAA